MNFLRESPALSTSDLRDLRRAAEIGREVAQLTNGRVSLRELASREGVLLSPATLGRALAVHRLVDRWPELLEFRHLRLSHVYAVLPLRRALQVRLLRRAETMRWSVAETKLQAEAVRTMRSDGGGTDIGVECDA
jgi:hypothetical protein